ncbi:BMP family protein [Pseudonocardia xishanensis]|uniref:BMP family ABC transporter substrate-binding protein n=1 Tax=Pseudonocardia xishanensis TaxID=630995 RepID=A0ABP8RQ48_9PSEU
MIRVPSWLRSTRVLAAPVLGAALVLSACSSGGSTAAPETAASGAPTKVGVVLAGPRNDKAFYQSYLDGVQAVADREGMTVSVVDNVGSPQAAIDALTNLAADNQLIIAGGSSLVSAGNTVAPQFPDVTFVMSGVVQTGVPNLHTYATRQGVPAYVAGVVAAQESATGTVGYVGGTDIPPNSQSSIDFAAGAKSVEPNINVASVTVGSLSDAAKAKEATAAQIANGADVIYAFQDAGLPGVLDAVTESGKDVKVFNPTTDRCEESPALIGYAFQDTRVMVGHVLEDYKAGTLPTDPRFYALDDPAVQALKLCPSATQYESVVADTTAKLNSGAITLPQGG